MKRRILVLTLVLALLVGLVPVVAQANNGPTPEEIKASIDAGLAWLLEQQNLDGSWGDWEQVAVTAFAVKKLEHYAVDPKYGLGLDSPFEAPYAEDLQAALNFLFRNASTMPIGGQPAGDPDSDGDGIGVYFGRIYNTGIVLMAIAESTTPDRVVDVPGSAVHDWTYAEVAQETVDYLSFGQNDLNWPRGGWGYDENQGWSDNSNTGYAVLGLQYAAAAPPEGFALTIPAFVKTELEIWIEYIQCQVVGPDHGGSGYTSPFDWVNILKTGNLLKELAFVGAGEADSRVQDALAYLHRHWNDPDQDPGWRGWPGGVADYQAMYTTMKGLTSLGIHKFCDPPCDSPIDWQADFEMVLLAEQLDDGSWPRTNWDYGSPPILSTLWALLTLEKVAPPPPCPEEPGTRTLGFYKNHPCVVEQVLPIEIAGETVEKAERAIEIIEDRGDHMSRLLSQLMVAKLNVAVFGIGDCPLQNLGLEGEQAVNEVIAEAEKLNADPGATKDQLSAMQDLLDSINNSNTDTPLPEEIAVACPPGGGPPKTPPGKGKK